MRAWGDRLAVALGVVMAAGSVAAQPVGAVESVLVAPVQGSEALRVQHGERVVAAVRRALLARGYQDAVSQELLGQAVVACHTHCVRCHDGSADHRARVSPGSVAGQQEQDLPR